MTKQFTAAHAEALRVLVDEYRDSMLSAIRQGQPPADAVRDHCGSLKLMIMEKVADCLEAET
jgi:hypothetical protein